MHNLSRLINTCAIARPTAHSPATTCKSRGWNFLWKNAQSAWPGKGTVILPLMELVSSTKLRAKTLRTSHGMGRPLAKLSFAETL